MLQVASSLLQYKHELLLLGFHKTTVSLKHMAFNMFLLCLTLYAVLALCAQFASVWLLFTFHFPGCISGPPYKYGNQTSGFLLLLLLLFQGDQENQAAFTWLTDCRSASRDVQ